MNNKTQPDAGSVPPIPENQPSADKKTHVVRFEVSPATMVQLILVLAGLWLLIKLWPVFLVLVVALLIVGTMSPAVSWMESRNVKRGLAIGIVFTLFFVSATLVLMLTVPTLVSQSSALVEQEPALRARLVEYFGHSNLTEPIANWLRIMALMPTRLRSYSVRVAALFFVTVSVFAIKAVLPKTYGVAAGIVL